jgi:hypothetical protein
MMQAGRVPLEGVPGAVVALRGGEGWSRLRGRADWRVSSTSIRAVLPAVGDPGAPDEVTDGDDGVGEVDERLDDCGPSFVAAGQASEGVVPGVGPLNMPALGGLNRGVRALVGDVAGLAGVVARWMLQKLVEHEHEHDPVGDAGLMTPQRMSWIVERPFGQERLELDPQRLGKP